MFAVPMKLEQRAAAGQIEGEQRGGKAIRCCGTIIRRRRTAPVEVREVSPAATPSPSMQGELNVGSVMPKPKFSSRRVCLRSMPNFRLWRPEVMETSAFRPQFRSWRFWVCVAGVSAKGSRLA